jgi:hypothetical protein
VAFAATAVHEHARRARRGPLNDELSIELLFWRCKQLDGNTSDGTSFSSASGAMSEPGQCDEALWPYAPARDLTATYTPPPAAVATDELRRATMTAVGAHAADVADVLRRNQPVIVGLKLWDGFYDCDSDSLSAPAGDVDPTALHAVCLVAFDGDRDVVLVRNSWGMNWGDDGYAWLALSALDEVLLEAWQVADDIDDD